MTFNKEMKTSQNGLEFISKWEGCILKPYYCVAGKRTIGIGHVIKTDEEYKDGVEITKEKALQLLREDVKICEDGIKRHIKVDLNQNQFDALVSFGFNCGVGVYALSEACKLLNQGNYDDYPEKILSWSKITVGGVKITNKGLYNRRVSEGLLFSGKLGSRASDDEVKWNVDSLKLAQEKLKQLGLYNKKVDGIWGPGTAAALESYAASKNASLGEDPKSGIPRALFESLKD